MNTTIDHFKNATLEAGIKTPDTIIIDGVLHKPFKHYTIRLTRLKPQLKRMLLAILTGWYL